MTTFLPSAFGPLPYKLWLHIQHELLYLSWALTEVALFAPLSFAFLSWARFWPPAQITLWLLLLMLLPFNLARLMSLLQIATHHQRTVTAVSLLLTVLISIRTLIYSPESIFDVSWLTDFFANIAQPDNHLWLRDVAVFFIVLIMWWRGLRLVNRQFDIQQVGFRLRLGIVVAPIAIWFSHVGLGWNITPFILLFFLAGLTAVSLIRVEQLEKNRSGQSASLGPRWISYIFAASLATVAVSGLLAVLISGESLMAAAGWLAPLVAAFYFGGATVINTLTYLVQPLIILLSGLIDWLALWLQNLFINTGIELNLQPTVDFSNLAATPDATEVVTVVAPPNVNTRILAILLMVAAVLLVSLVLGRLFREASFASRDSEMIHRSGQQPGDDLNFGQRLLQRLGLLRNWRTAASIRRIYQQMLAMAADIGYPRAESETPFEFLPTLAEIWPDNTADSQLITQAFVKVRYGELPETEEELAAIDAAWQRLRDAVPAPADGTPRLEKRLNKEQFQQN
ncbi:MAG: DUF4129 domain-containing protein [Ardenticatenaceae bacterium]|nr:DUF4129 domain-containing protein [Ardenticatenaceae bacterium]